MVRALAIMCTLLWFSAGADVVARPFAVGQITLVEMFADGGSGASYSETDETILSIYLAGMPAACTTGLPRAAIRSDHPMFDSIRSMAFTAYTAGREVQLTWNEECNVIGDSWDIHGLDMNP